MKKKLGLTVLGILTTSALLLTACGEEEAPLQGSNQPVSEQEQDSNQVQADAGKVVFTDAMFTLGSEENGVYSANLSSDHSHFRFTEEPAVPEDYAITVKVMAGDQDVTSSFTYEKETLNWTEAVTPAVYTVIVSDANGKYAEYSQEFMLVADGAAAMFTVGTQDEDGNSIAKLSDLETQLSYNEVPEDFEITNKVTFGDEDVTAKFTFAEDSISWTGDLMPGSYKFIMSDAKGFYVNNVQTLTLMADGPVATFDGTKIVKLEGASDEAFTAFLAGLGSATVLEEGVEESFRIRSGLIAEDGSLDFSVTRKIDDVEVPAFTQGISYNITVSCNGYDPLVFDVVYQ